MFLYLQIKKEKKNHSFLSVWWWTPQVIATSRIILSNDITFLLCMDSIPLSQVKDDNEYVCSRGKVKKKIKISDAFLAFEIIASCCYNSTVYDAKSFIIAFMVFSLGH